jgi:hypothetical protein
LTQLVGRSVFYRIEKIYMEKHSQLPEQIRNARQDWLHSRWVQLNGLEKAWSDHVFKYLLLTNSGGAIAVLSFLATYKSGMSLVTAKIALGCFVFGVIVVGCAAAQTFHRMSSGVRGINTDTRRVYGDEIEYAELITRDNARHDYHWTRLVLPYGAFAAFIIGCIVGAIGILLPPPATTPTSATPAPSSHAESHSPHNSVAPHP